MLTDIALQVLQRQDSHITRIISQTSFISLYVWHRVQTQWVKLDVEGLPFIVERNIEPKHLLIVRNQKTPLDLVLPLIKGWDIQSQANYIFLKLPLEVDSLPPLENEDAEKLEDPRRRMALWFHDDSQRILLLQPLFQIVNDLNTKDNEPDLPPGLFGKNGEKSKRIDEMNNFTGENMNDRSKTPSKDSREKISDSVLKQQEIIPSKINRSQTRRKRKSTELAFSPVVTKDQRQADNDERQGEDESRPPDSSPTAKVRPPPGFEHVAVSVAKGSKEVDNKSTINEKTDFKIKYQIKSGGKKKEPSSEEPPPPPPPPPGPPSLLNGQVILLQKKKPEDKTVTNLEDKTMADDSPNTPDKTEKVPVPWVPKPGVQVRLQKRPKDFVPVVRNEVSTSVKNPSAQNSIETKTQIEFPQESGKPISQVVKSGAAQTFTRQGPVGGLVRQPIEVVLRDTNISKNEINESSTGILSLLNSLVSASSSQKYK